MQNIARRAGSREQYSTRLSCVVLETLSRVLYSVYNTPSHAISNLLYA